MKSLIAWTVAATMVLVGVAVSSFAQPAEKAAKEKPAPAKIPAVVLSKAHQALCKAKVGDTLPEIMAPQVGGGLPTKLSSFFGDKATVVVFWKGDRRMAREELSDLGPDVIEPFGKAGVNVLGIAVDTSETDAQTVLKAAEADFTNWIDSDGKAFAQVGSAKLPRTYLLDPKGKILWFDIEYSLGTRRDLNEALRAVAGEPKTDK